MLVSSTKSVAEHGRRHSRFTKIMPYDVGDGYFLLAALSQAQSCRNTECVTRHGTLMDLIPLNCIHKTGQNCSSIISKFFFLQFLFANRFKSFAPFSPATNCPPSGKKFIARILAGDAPTHIAKRFMVSRSTMYRIKKKYEFLGMIAD